MFSMLPKTKFNFSVTSMMSSAIAFNLDQSEILSLGKESTHLHEALYQVSHHKTMDSQNPFCLITNRLVVCNGPLTYRKFKCVKKFENRSACWDCAFVDMLSSL